LRRLLNVFAYLSTALPSGASCRGLPFLGWLPTEASRYSAEVGPDPASHEGMVRCRDSNSWEMLFTHVSRIVPNYDLAPDLGQVDILRVVVKENFTEALLDRLLSDIVCVRAACYYSPH
jgi:hypothetical protein